MRRGLGGNIVYKAILTLGCLATPENICNKAFRRCSQYPRRMVKQLVMETIEVGKKFGFLNSEAIREQTADNKVVEAGGDVKAESACENDDGPSTSATASLGNRPKKTVRFKTTRSSAAKATKNNPIKQRRRNQRRR